MTAPDPPPDSPSEHAPSRSRVLLAGLLLILATFAVFSPVTGNGFVHFDDSTYIVDNPRVTAGLTAEGIRWAFQGGYASNWHPLTWMSHMLDCELFGVDATRHHLMSVALHAITAALLLAALATMTRAFWPSLWIAALFALHPTRVESVVWAAERKDVLCALFWVLTMLAYARYVRRPGAGRYLLVLLAFALGLMSKSMIVTLPAVLLLLDFWPLGRGGGGAGRPLARLLVEKVPLLGMAIATGVMTVVSQGEGGAIGSLEFLAISDRIYNALQSVFAYLGMTLWPSGLACIYPHPAITDPGSFTALLGPAILAGVFLVAITWFAWRRRASGPWFTVGWLWYLGTLLPVIGLLQVGMQARADRYTYLPLIGIYVIVAFGLRALVTRRPQLRMPVVTFAAASVIACAVLTARLIPHWENTETVFARALAVTERNYIAHLNLGTALDGRGEREAARRHFLAALEINPKLPEAHNNLAGILWSRGKSGEALEHYREAVRLNPELLEAFFNLGVVHASRDEREEAADAFARAIELNPDHPEIRSRHGGVLLELGRIEEALTQYQELARIEPENVEAHLRAGYCLASLRRIDEAIVEFESLLAIHPNHPDGHNNLGVMLGRLGDDAGAAKHYRLAIENGMEGVSAAHNLAWILATSNDESLRDPPEALRLARRCLRLAPQPSFGYLKTLAAAHAAAGDFPAAIEQQARAIDLAPEAKHDELRADLEEFRAGRALRR